MWQEVVLVAGVLLVPLVAMVSGLLGLELVLVLELVLELELGVPALFEGPVLLYWEKPW